MPDWRTPLARRLAALRLTPAREHEIIEELSQHLDDRYHELRGEGHPHDRAVALSLDEIGEVDDSPRQRTTAVLAQEMRPLKQASQPTPLAPGESRGNWLADALLDVRYSARVLLAGRAWTLVVVLLLALGIGANTALFSATSALMLAPVHVADADSLVRFRWHGKNDTVTEHDEYGFAGFTPDRKPVRASFSYGLFQQFSAGARDVAEVFACVPVGNVTVTAQGQAELADGFLASGNYFRALGVNAQVGRVFTPEDDSPGAPLVAVISSGYWRSRFSGDPAVVGRAIKVNDTPVTIVGVLPPEFTGVQSTIDDAPDISMPLTSDLQTRASTGRGDASLLSMGTAWWIQIMGRIHPGVTVAQLRESLDPVFKRTALADFDAFSKTLSEDARRSAPGAPETPQLLIDSGRRGVYDPDPNAVTSATILCAVVAVVLLIVCANVANLMLSRAVARRRELSVRLSLGATRSRLLRQLLTEALLLASAGAALGLLVAYWGVRLLPDPVSHVSVFRGPVLLFVTAAAVLTALLFGAMPAVRATRLDVNATLKEAGRSIAGRRSFLARALLVVQVALSLVLIVGAGLFLKTLANLRTTDVGFDTNNLLLVRITPRVSGYDQPRSLMLYRELIGRLGSIPGVKGATLSVPALLSGSESSTSIYREGYSGPPADRDSRDHDIHRLVVSPEFFKVMGIPVVLGRGLTEQDNASAPRVTVINEAAAHAFFPNENPIGKRFGTSTRGTSQIEIVGVVKDTKYASVRDAAPPTMFDTYTQSPRAYGVITLRTAAAPTTVAAAVRQTVHDVDPNLPIISLSTQRDQMERRFAQERLFAGAYGLFGALALLLASVGLFGLMSYNVARRTSEMGIRMALGARPAAVLGMVMRESMLLVVAGIALGLVIAFASGRLVAKLLFGLGATDLPTTAIAIAVMALVSAAAAYIPARRASLVDPNVALRTE